MITHSRLESFTVALIAILACGIAYVYAADCQVAIVGSPYGDCFDIYTAAGITAAQFASYNPGLNCSLLQPGQRVCISPGTLPSNAPSPSPNGTCAMYTIVSGDNCAAIAVKFDITVNEIETWNEDTYKWNGCADLQVDFTMCVSSGTPPPIPVDPNLECGPASPGNATCPLKACCSAFGFCGLTDSFCATTGTNPCISNCFTPTLPSCNGSGFKRNIGYWASWAARRPCGAFTPSQADWSSYTHAHFAFATITQDYQLLIADEDEPFLEELLSVKKQVSGLKVVLAVGGWAFSEADPTKDLFSLMISSSSTRATFISSVGSTLAQYGLDGIDIDFEYPGAVERNAPATDTPNLTAFFSELRSALPSTIISVAAPAGYWFLKGFEIDKIASSVTYINMMSYDYHGPWDTNVTDQAPVTNPHTSILDMQDSALLYVRAGIDLSIVNLGLAWYGRTFQLADDSCLGYNCTMVGGGTPGPCSDASGILAQFEILALMQQQGLSATLDTPSETYWFDDKNGDLVTFDQANTWAAKQKFAQNACFGGSFVWSLDQVSQNGSSSSGSSGSSSPGSYSLIPWNPNPHPAATAASATFIAAGSTTVVAVPTVTTTISVGGDTIVLGPGGTPVNSPVPAGVTQPNAVTPTWTYNIIPPSSASSVTFTAPLTGFPTYSSVAGVPTVSGAAPAKITGPPGDTNCDGSNQWLLTFGPSIQGCLPGDVGVPGGTTPSAVPPAGWTGPWTDPVEPHSVTTVGVQSHSYTYVTWNPNPYPPPTAVSETFVRSSSTTIIPIPIVTVTVTLGDETLTIGPGGTPEISLLPTDITLVSAVTPTWTRDILPPPGATSVEFTAPLTSRPTYSSAVPVPTSSNQPGNEVQGPPNDHGRCGSSNAWTVLFGAIIDGCLPLDVGISGGITPYPLKPTGWVGTWSNPYPLPTGAPPEDGDEPTSTTSSSSSSSSASSTSSGACLPAQTTAYTLPDDPENQDWEDEGTDPDFRRRRRAAAPVAARAALIDPRRIAVARCPGLNESSPAFVDLEDAPNSVAYYHVNESESISTNLIRDTVAAGNGRPNTGMTIQEHIFELGYVSQFFGSATFTNVPCSWIQDNIFTALTIDGTQTIAQAILAVIDNYNNMVWADVPMNQAKSNVVNNNRAIPTNPPQKEGMNYIAQSADFRTQLDVDKVWMLEAFIRSFAALGDYFNQTSDIFQNTATQVQQILAQVTPNDVTDEENSLPLLFWDWLNNTLQAYPDGCTSRATNVYVYYGRSMQTSSARQGFFTVPPCFELYWAGIINLSTFDYEDLLPTLPEPPQCFVPGTKVQVTFASDSQHAYTDSLTYTVLGIGDINYYGLGTGTSGAGTRWQYTQYQTSDACNGVYSIQNGGGGATTGIDITDCDSGTASPVVAGAQQAVVLPHCDVLVSNVVPGYTLLCGTDQTSVNACSTQLYNIGGNLAWLVGIQNVDIYFH